MNWKHTISSTTQFPLVKYSWLNKTSLNKEVNLGFIKILTQKKWFIRLVNKEYWSAYIYTFPLIFYGTYFAARTRFELFFTAANPAIPTGGMVGENKADISRWIPAQYRPKNVLIQLSDSMKDIQSVINKAGMQFPLVLKPVVGCRGLMVEKVNNLDEAIEHILRFPTDFLVEEFIDYAVEAAVLYWKNPEIGKSGIQSIAGKEFLNVIGDGKQTVKHLLRQESRGILQIERLEKDKPELLKYIPQLNEKILVEPIGNHCRGTKFLNYNHLISTEMVAAFDKIQNDLPGCYVFRLDIKTPTLSDLQMGHNIKILEINGVGSDPAHIYDPNTPFFEIWAAYIRLWKKIFEVSTALHRSGVPYMKLGEYKNYKKNQKDIEKLVKHEA